MKTRIAIAAVLALAGAAVAQNGGGGGGDTPLIQDSGWIYDQLDAAGAPTSGSPWEFTIETKCYFRITDDFIIGDTWTAVDSTLGNLGSSTFFGPRPPTAVGGPGEAAWQSGAYTTFEISLPAGSYSISIFGDGAGGIPAGLWVQLEKVPAPGTLALLGMGGLVAARRRR